MQVLQEKIHSLFSTALESEYELFALLSSVYSPAPPTVFSCFQLDLQNIQNPRRKGRGEECTPPESLDFFPPTAMALMQRHEVVEYLSCLSFSEETKKIEQ